MAWGPTEQEGAERTESIRGPLQASRLLWARPCPSLACVNTGHQAGREGEGGLQPLRPHCPAQWPLS